MYNKHHTYPKRHRSPAVYKTNEVKVVDRDDHRAWHSLMTDRHPTVAARRLRFLLFRNPILTITEQKALNTLLQGRSKLEYLKYCKENFLPTKGN